MAAPAADGRTGRTGRRREPCSPSIQSTDILLLRSTRPGTAIAHDREDRALERTRAMHHAHPIRHHAVTAVLGALLCAGLVAGAVAPVAAAERSDATATVVGGFGIGDGLEAVIGEADGSVRFGLTLGAFAITWDSRRLGADRLGFGPGWASALSYVDLDGGAQVVAPSGRVHPINQAFDSGLDGYVTGDVAFRATAGELVDRDGGGSVAYSYVLHELGGTTTYFDAQGDPVEQTTATGNRTSWRWDERHPHRLIRSVDPDGVVTELAWPARRTGEIVVTTGANLGEHARAWRVRVGADGLTVRDPASGRSQIVQDESGRVTRITGPSGAETDVAWTSSDDGIARVAEVRTTGPGIEPSVRTWSATDGGAGVTGWPATDVTTGALPGAYRTVLADGATRVSSTYSPHGLLTERRVEVSSATGTRLVEARSYGYPATAGRTAADLPAQYNRPTTAEVTHHDAAGGRRTTSESYRFDEFGRLVERIAADGATTTTEYDPHRSDDRDLEPVPIGLPLRERTVAADGLVSETRYEFDDRHAVVTARETFTGERGTPEPTRTGRTEYRVEEDGFISAELTFPQGGAGTPSVTEFSRAVDLATGLLTEGTTVGAGTAAAATTERVTNLAHRQVVETTDALGNVSSAEFDALGRLETRTDAVGNVTRMAYETEQADGRNATSVTGPDRVRVTEERDVLGRVTRVTDNRAGGEPVDGHERVVETRSYEGAGTVRITDAWGAVTETRQDAHGRPVATTASTGLTEVTRYDDVAGTVTTGFTPTGDLADADLTATQTFDVNGRAVAASGERGDGVEVPSTSAIYDGQGRLARSTGATTTTDVEFDAFGNPEVTTVTPRADASAAALTGAERGATTATRRFDERGVSQEKILSDGEESRAGYAETFDELGRMLTSTDQLGRTTTYRYTVDGLVDRVEHADGGVSEYEYELETRRLHSSRTSGTADQASVRTEYAYDALTGAITSVFDPEHPTTTTISYDYDGFGNVTRVAYPEGETVEHDYDDHGRKVRTTDVEKNVTTFGYDEHGVMTSVEQVDPHGAALAGVRYEHDDHGRVTAIDRGNGVVTRITYTSASQVESEVTAQGSTVLTERTYAYEPSGNLATRVDVSYEGGTRSATTTAYTYDATDRLLSSTVHAGDDTAARATSRTDYVVNVSGDVTSETVTDRPGAADASAATRTFDYSDRGELERITTTAADGTATTATQEHDAAGNLVRGADGTRYRYDALNRPIAETTPEGATIATAYWADGNRRDLTVPGEGLTGRSTTFYWDGDTLVNDEHTTGTGDRRTAAYLIGTSRHARTVGGDPTTAAYSTADRHGNVTELTGTDGSVTTRYTYSDYGLTTERPAPTAAPAELVGDADRNPFRYGGEQADPTGKLYLHARLYDAGPARFLTADAADLHNKYGFGDGNPIMNLDPTGHFATADIINVITIGVSAVMLAFSVVSTVYTGGLSLGWAGLFTTVGFAAEGAGLGIGTALIVNDHYEQFMPHYVKQGLQYAEYGLMGLSVVGGIGSAVGLARHGKRAAVPAGKAGKAGEAGKDHLTPLPQLKQQTMPTFQAEPDSTFYQFVNTRAEKAVDFLDSDAGSWYTEQIKDQTLVNRIYGEVDAPLTVASGKWTATEEDVWLFTHAQTFADSERTVGEIRAAVLAKIDEAALDPATKDAYRATVNDHLFELSSTHPKFAGVHTHFTKNAPSPGFAEEVAGDWEDPADFSFSDDVDDALLGNN
jgi:RHS repeat-associated protein